MTAREHLSIGLWLLRLLAKIFIFWPATVFASAIFLILFFSNDGVHDISEVLHRVVITASFEQPAVGSRITPELEVLPPIVPELPSLHYDSRRPAETAISAIAGALSNIYWSLVVLSVFITSINFVIVTLLTRIEIEPLDPEDKNSAS